MGPFLLRPIGKDYLWGGNRLNTVFQKNIPLSPLAETWECSVHPDGSSVVVGGVHDGETLSAVLQSHPAYIGSAFDGEFPILIKLIDALQDLSVQVHPDDAYARAHEGDNGKSEMWYILDAQPGASLVYGFRHDVTPDMLRNAVESGTLDEHLNRVPVHPGDVFYIPAGTIHALGAGILVAEVQESSNVTYRVYDYDRRDKDGGKRPLHLEKALKVMDMSPVRSTSTTAVTLRGEGYDETVLCDCPYFKTDWISLHDHFSFSCDDTAFAVLLMTEGEGVLTGEATHSMRLKAGDCVFCPAGSGEARLTGNASFLKIVCKPNP